MTQAAARRPRPVPMHGGRRTVHCRIEVGAYAGWEWTAYADFKAKVYVELMSGDLGRVIKTLQEKVIIEHNFPDFDDPDTRAQTLGDVDVGALELVVDRTFDEIGKLPSR